MSKLSRISEGLKKNWRRGDPLSEPIVQGSDTANPFPDLSVYPIQTGTRRWYSWNKKQWMTGAITYRMAPQKFAEGKMRVAHFMEELMSDGTRKQLVAKKPKFQKDESKTYQMDVITQAACQAIARAYNLRKPAKPVYFIEAFILEQSDGSQWHVEMYLKGLFVKHNNNWGLIAGMRNTPQAFSHFSYEFSKGRMIVVDIQGVDDYYTDPQIHTTDGQGFGIGNMGQAGIDRFLRTHHCSDLCANLNLSFMAPKVLGIIPRTQPRHDGTIDITEPLTLQDDQMKVSEFLGQMRPNKNSARAEELTLLGMTMAQFNTLASEFRNLDTQKTGFLEREQVYDIFRRLQAPDIRNKEEDFAAFAARVEMQLDQEAMVDFKSYLLCWTNNV